MEQETVVEAEVDKIYQWSPMIRMSDMKYPVYLQDFLKEHTNVSQGDWVYAEGMARDFKYFLVHESDIPKGDVVTEGMPVLSEDGKWYKTYTSRDFTESEISNNLARRKVEVKEEADFRYEQDLIEGIPVDGELFSGTSSSVLQLIVTKSYADSSQGLIRISNINSDIVEYSPEEAKVKIDKILLSLGKVQQSYLGYLSSVFSSTDISEIPEVPLTFVGE